MILYGAAGPGRTAVDILAVAVKINQRSAMNIEIHDQEVAARLEKQLQRTGSESVEEVLLHLLETQEEQDRWLLEGRESNDAKIQRGIEQLQRGEGIPEDRVDEYLRRLKSRSE